MEYVLHSGSISGFPTNSHWSYTFSTRNFLILIEVVGEEAGLVGRKCLEQIRQELVANYPHTLADLKRILEKETGEVVTLIGGLVCGDVLYIVIKNGGAVYLKRKDTLVELLKQKGSISGRLEKNDRLVLSGPRCLTYLSEIDLKESLQEKSLESVTDYLTTKLHRQSGSPAGALLVVGFTPETQSTPKFSPIPSLKQLGGKFLSFFIRKPLGVVIGVLFFLLLVSIGIGLWQGQISKQGKEIQTVINEVNHNYEEGMALVDLNPVRARELLQEAKKTLEVAQKNVHSDSSHELSRYLEKVESGIAFALRRYEIVPTTFIDLSLIKPQGEGTRMALYQDVLVVLDTKNQSVYRIGLTSKTSRIIAGGKDVVSVKAIAPSGEEIYLLHDRGISQILSGGNIKEVVNTQDKWGKVTEIAAFGGSLYVLDTSKNQIWKYIHEDTGFSSAQDYLLFDTQVDLGNTVSLRIDGSVWLVRGKEILKFTQGKPDVWQIAGLPKGFGSVISLYLDETTKNIYVWDKDNRRIVVVDKTGVYLSQYHWQEDLMVIDFVVSEPAKKILLLSRGTIYGIDLK